MIATADELFERSQRSERALVAALAEMYVQGVSTRKVKAITEELCGHTFSAPLISAINDRLDESWAKFPGRPLSDSFPYLILDTLRVDTRSREVHTMNTICSGLITLFCLTMFVSEGSADAQPTECSSLLPANNSGANVKIATLDIKTCGHENTLGITVTDVIYTLTGGNTLPSGPEHNSTLRVRYGNVFPCYNKTVIFVELQNAERVALALQFPGQSPFFRLLVWAAPSDMRPYPWDLIKEVPTGLFKKVAFINMIIAVDGSYAHNGGSCP